MNLLINLVGNAEQMIFANNLDTTNCEIVKLDEKELSNPKHILSLIKGKDFENVYFGTIDLNFQRFQFFIKLYLFLSFYWKGAIIDEKGDNKILFSLVHFLFVDIPLIVVEIFASVYLAIYYHIKVYLVRWKYKKN